MSLIETTEAFFKKKNLASARLDAEVLLGRALGVNRVSLYMMFDRPVADSEVDAYRLLVARRAKGEPVAYIMGEKEFWSRRFKVGPGVLIPRPETELLVERAKTLVGNQPLSILDIGTGSGVLGITLAAEYPLSRVTASDISEEALAYARENAAAHGVSDRVAFLSGDFFANVPQGPFDLIVSNPPYIATGELENLPVSVKDFEPRGALDGGNEGLAFYGQIGKCAPHLLAPNGFLIVETGEDNAHQTADIFRENGLTASVFKDYAGLDRMVVAEKK